MVILNNPVAVVDWPFKKAIVNLPIKLKGNSKRTSGNTFST